MTVESSCSINFDLK